MVGVFKLFIGTTIDMPRYFLRWALINLDLDSSSQGEPEKTETIKLELTRTDKNTRSEGVETD